MAAASSGAWSGPSPREPKQANITCWEALLWAFLAAGSTGPAAELLTAILRATALGRAEMSHPDVLHRDRLNQAPAVAEMATGSLVTGPRFLLTLFG